MTPKVFQCVRFARLTLEIHTVGYPKMGESIVTFLKDDSRVMLTIVTDSFKTDHADVVKNILDSNGHPSIDLFIWTHPDEDHSVGIEALLEAFDPNHQASIYMPANLDEDIMPCASAKNALAYLEYNYNTGRRYLLNPICIVKNQVLKLSTFVIHERFSNRNISGSFNFLLPNGPLTSRRCFHKANNPGDINDFSLVYVLELNGIHYLFGGDMTSQSIQFIDSDNFYFLENIRYVKIPHHGSKDPSRLVDMLIPYQPKKAVATTTVFKTTHPDKEALDKYFTICEHISSTDRGNLDSGSIKLEFNLSNMRVPSPVCNGNAKIVRSN